MTVTLIVPGLRSSGPEHWQTWFEERIPGTVRVIQRDWSHADLPEWSSRVRREISRIPGPIIVVAHSFGVLAAVQAADDLKDRIVGALFVAPADPDTLGVSDYLPRAPLPFPSILVASSNDSWMSLDRAAFWSDLWGSELINLGAVGHINVESGFGPWPEGLRLLEQLRRSVEYSGTDAATYPPLPGESHPLPAAWRGGRERHDHVHGREHIARKARSRSVG